MIIWHFNFYRVSADASLWRYTFIQCSPRIPSSLNLHYSALVVVFRSLLLRKNEGPSFAPCAWGASCFLVMRIYRSVNVASFSWQLTTYLRREGDRSTQIMWEPQFHFHRPDWFLELRAEFYSSVDKECNFDHISSPLFVCKYVEWLHQGFSCWRR